MTRSGDPRLLRGLLSHRVLVLSNTLARAAANTNFLMRSPPPEPE